jgi:hypothetical protein
MDAGSAFGELGLGVRIFWHYRLGLSPAADVTTEFS